MGEGIERRASFPLGEFLITSFPTAFIKNSKFHPGNTGLSSRRNDEFRDTRDICFVLRGTRVKNK